jgi:hypothetical protein
MDEFETYIREMTPESENAQRDLMAEALRCGREALLQVAGLDDDVLWEEGRPTDEELKRAADILNTMRAAKLSVRY